MNDAGDHFEELAVADMKVKLRAGIDAGNWPQRGDAVFASPAADLLLPLTTALEKELGLAPRVAKEVEEVAEDILRDMAERRRSRDA